MGLWLGLIGMTSELIQNQDSISCKFQVSHKAMKHLVTKKQKIKKAPVITVIFVCACIATARRNNLRVLSEAASSWTGFCCASGRCVDFLCPP